MTSSPPDFSQRLQPFPSFQSKPAPSLQHWLDATPPLPRALSPQNTSDFSSSGGSPPLSHLTPTLPPITPAQSIEDEIIPTAIVIKNIPFNVKRETLLELIASLAIPTPYAFNYHLDQQGAFRGLAFANFRQASDADAVVAALNGFDVQGRKLRVEYKKVLQAGEKERIEREKAIRRMRSMQLEKEHQHAAAAAAVVASVGVSPLYDDYPSPFSASRSFSAGTPYQQQYSPPGLSSSIISSTYNLSLGPPSPAPAQATSPQQQQPPQPISTPSVSEKGAINELDMNDPSTLEIYSRVLLFKDDHMRDELAFSRTLTPKQRRIVHLVAQKLGVYHYSVGEGDERYAVVTRIDPQRQQQSSQRAPHTLSRAPSAYLAGSGQATTTASTLRVKKSMPDMKTLHSQAPRLTSRASNGNIREGFATIASPSRRISSGYNSLFSTNSPFGTGMGIPPVPSLPPNLNTANLNGNPSSNAVEITSPSGVVRQPRGPGAGGFGRRDSRVTGAPAITAEATPSRSGPEAQTHEPLEL
ncbi:hypothetical protein APHAL10511_001342 [Amanita phalloides]|nr:hypothetical protein APHAL10511_001342 [Amanita phalloides]